MLYITDWSAFTLNARGREECHSFKSCKSQTKEAVNRKKMVNVSSQIVKADQRDAKQFVQRSTRPSLGTASWPPVNWENGSATFRSGWRQVSPDRPAEPHTHTYLRPVQAKVRMLDNKFNSKITLKGKHTLKSLTVTLKRHRLQWSHS